jgi:hypothetical protein
LGTIQGRPPLLPAGAAAAAARDDPSQTMAGPPPAPPAHLLDAVGRAVDDVAELVARALDLLAVELHHHKGLVLDRLELHQLDLAHKQDGGVLDQALGLGGVAARSARPGT